MKVRILKYFLPGLAVLFFMVSCHHEEDNTMKNESNKLYSGTLKLIKEYSDSLSYASDTLAVTTIFQNFNKSLEKLNFEVIPDTDLELTEGQNDTLYMKLCEIRAHYDEKMKEVMYNAIEAEGEAEDSLDINEL